MALHLRINKDKYDHCYYRNPDRQETFFCFLITNNSCFDWLCTAFHSFVWLCTLGSTMTSTITATTATLTGRKQFFAFSSQIILALTVFVPLFILSFHSFVWLCTLGSTRTSTITATTATLTGRKQFLHSHHKSFLL